MSMKKYQFGFGAGSMELSLPSERILYDIKGTAVEAIDDVPSAVRQALRNPIGAAPLAQTVRAGDKVVLTYGKDRYGPLDMNVAAEHLDAQGLLALKTKFAQIADTEMSEEQIQDELIQTAKTDASGLFTQNPVLNVKAFKFTMPQGNVDASGTLAFKGLVQKDLDNLADMLKKTEADFKIQVPQKLLEQMAINQARSIFSVNPEDEAAGRATIEDINETLRLMVDSTIQSMARDQYLTLQDNHVKTHLNLQNSELKLNGKVLETEPEAAFDESDMLPDDAFENEAASAASTAP